MVLTSVAVKSLILCQQNKKTALNGRRKGMGKPTSCAVLKTLKRNGNSVRLFAWRVHKFCQNRNDIAEIFSPPRIVLLSHYFFQLNSNKCLCNYRICLDLLEYIYDDSRNRTITIRLTYKKRRLRTNQCWCRQRFDGNIAAVVDWVRVHHEFNIVTDGHRLHGVSSV